jgi:hypothetical protein
VRWFNVEKLVLLNGESLLRSLGRILSRVEIIFLERRKKDCMVGFHEGVEMDRKVGFLVNLVKMIRKALNLVGERMHLKGLNRGVAQLVPLVRLTKGGKVHELENYSERNELS